MIVKNNFTLNHLVNDLSTSQTNYQLLCPPELYKHNQSNQPKPILVNVQHKRLVTHVDPKTNLHHTGFQ